MLHLHKLVSNGLISSEILSLPCSIMGITYSAYDAYGSIPASSVPILSRSSSGSASNLEGSIVVLGIDEGRTATTVALGTRVSEEVELAAACAENL